MARVWQSGFEVGHKDCLDLGAGGAIESTTTRGSWSQYSWHTDGSSGEASFGGAQLSEWYCGLGFYRTANVAHFLEFRNVNASLAVELTINGSFFIEAKLGRDGTILATGATAVTVNSWHFVECRFKIADAGGVIEVKLDGVTQFTFSGDTRYDAAANGDKFTSIVLGETTNTCYYDDVWVNDTTGTRNIGYSGDVRIKAYIPNAAGDVTGMSRGGTDSGSNYGQVDERPPNDVTDYVTAAGTSLYDLYNIPNTSGVDTVQAVTLWLRAQKSDAGAKNVAHVLKYDTDASGTADTENVGSDVALSTSWAYYGKVYNDDPGATAWSAAKIDALQVGAKAR